MSPKPTDALSGPSEAPYCVIVAAGEGRRLSSMGPDRPKPLTRLLGLSLAERTVAACMAVGLRRFVVVLGHRAEKVRAHFEWVAARRGCSIEFALATDWKLGNGASALAARTHVPAGPFLVVMADHLITPSLLDRVLAVPPRPGDVRVAIDRDREALFDPEDATKVALENERVTRIGKDVRWWLAADVGVLYCTRELFEGLDRAGARGRHAIADGLRDLADRRRLRAVDVTGEQWVDIDTPAAYRHARRRLLSSLAKGGQDGFVSAYLNRRVSVRLSARLAERSVTPNQITVASFLVALAGAGLLALGQYPAAVLGALLVQISSITDGCDGEIARLKHLATPRGAWLDTILDRYADLALVFAVTFAQASAVGGVRPWVGGFIAATGFLLASYVTKEFALRHAHEYPNDVLNRLRRRDLRLFGIFCGALVGHAFAAMVALGVLSHLCAVGILLRGWRRREPISYRAA
jgi:CDP-L-myo-inositol myo-inositolphosphotransferase